MKSQKPLQKLKKNDQSILPSGRYRPPHFSDVNLHQHCQLISFSCPTDFALIAFFQSFLAFQAFWHEYLGHDDDKTDFMETNN